MSNSKEDINYSDFLSKESSYHNHKENMAHAGILLMVSLFGIVLTLDVWPPDWVKSIEIVISKEILSCLFISFIWLLIHIFIRWQLVQRRRAATKTAAYERLLLKIGNDGKDKELPQFRCVWLDYIIPRNIFYQEGDIEFNKLPSELRKVILEQINQKSKSTVSEWIIFWSSILILVIMIFRTLVSIP